KGKGVTELYLWGLAADICVYFSAYYALKEGFRCYFIEDASKTVDDNVFESLRKEMRAMGIAIVNSNDLEKSLARNVLIYSSKELLWIEIRHRFYQIQDT